MSLGLQRVSGSRPHRRSREADAAVVLADVDESAVRAEAETLVGAGHTALAIRCDVSDDAAVAAMVDRTVAELGRLDTAFNNAEVMARIHHSSMRKKRGAIFGTKTSTRCASSRIRR